MAKVLGIDQGIASVGWGIIDTETNTIVDAGVRLFNEADKANNEGRRSFRSGRRVKRRRVGRRKDLEKLLKSYDLFDENWNSFDPYLCRKRGLNEKLSIAELDCALFNICKHRGSALDVAEEEVSENEQSTKYQISQNDSLLKSGKYVCEIQLDRKQIDGKIRGINNNFRSSDYKKELEKILSVQEIDGQKSVDIINCIFRKRNFDEGPGSFKSQTPYGRIYNEDGTVKVGMIEKMTGHCSVFPEELRSPKMAPSAELFNLLNDLNNLRIDDERIDVEDKKEIVDLALKKGSITARKIADQLGVELTKISGFRIDKNDKPLVTELAGYKIFFKSLF